MGGQETSDSAKANHPRMHQSPRATVHKTGQNNQRSRSQGVAYCRLYGAERESIIALMIRIGQLHKDRNVLIVELCTETDKIGKVSFGKMSAAFLS
jgi:hypothetical protein